MQDPHGEVRAIRNNIDVIRQKGFILGIEADKAGNLAVIK